jgi:hypothetical protein
MRSTPLIGLLGYARAGKDAAAEVLRSFGLNRGAFADALKEDIEPVASKLGLCMTRDKERLRPLMVEYGRLARSVDPDYWVRKLVLSYEDFNAFPWCIADVRYLNEARHIQNAGGVLLWIKRPGCSAANEEEVRSFREIKDAIKAGELPVSLLVNDRTLPEFQEAVREWFRGVFPLYRPAAAV